MSDSNKLSENENAVGNAESGHGVDNATSAPNAADVDVVYSSYCAYSPLIAWMLLVAPLTTICCGLLVWLKDDEPPAEREFAIKILVGTTIGILVLYFFTLPVRVSVKSDGAVCVRVIPITYTFIGTVRAYHSPGMWDDAYRARIKFATNQDRRVIVLRRKGKWDLCVSPTNPKDFVDAVSSVMTTLEAQAGVS